MRKAAGLHQSARATLGLWGKGMRRQRATGEREGNLAPPSRYSQSKRGGYPTLRYRENID